MPTESLTTSGITYGGGVLWLAANGPGERWRTPRATDATTGEVVKADPNTGETLARYPLPGGSGTHGIEYDRLEESTLWLTTIHSNTISQVRADDWSVVRTIPITLGGGTHGIVRVADGMWVAHRTTRRILKLDVETGRDLDVIQIPDSEPEPHGLSIFGDDLLYCDATTGWVVKITLS